GDWSSDVCSSDLVALHEEGHRLHAVRGGEARCRARDRADLALQPTRPRDLGDDGEGLRPALAGHLILDDRRCLALAAAAGRPLLPCRGAPDGRAPRGLRSPAEVASSDRGPSPVANLLRGEGPVAPVSLDPALTPLLDGTGYSMRKCASVVRPVRPLMGRMS